MKDKLVPSPLIKQFLNQAEHYECLDIGAGRGDNIIFLAKTGFSATALEVREDSANIIKKRARANKVSVKVENKDVRKFNINKNHYSLVSAIHSLNFFSKDEFLNLITKIKAGLTNDGLCVISMFTTKDSMYEELKQRVTLQKDNSLADENGKKWYFPKPNELKKLFKDFEILFYVEAIIDDKGHPGKESPHKHTVARIVAKNKSA